MKFIRRFKNEEGSVIVIVAVCMTVLMAFTSLVIDLGLSYIEKSKLQDAIDAAALSAAQELPDTTEAQIAANHYIELNGYSASDISISFSNNNNTIHITGNKTINYLFAKIIGIDNSTVQASTAAEKESIGKAFDYALFSGSPSATLTLNGSHQSVTGDAHSNKNFIINGSNLTITGACEAVTTVTINGSNIDVGDIVQHTPLIDMPDFSDQLQSLAEAAGQVYQGNKTYSNSYVSIEAPIFVNGNISINGSHFSGKGAIVATGNITFNGSNLYGTSDSSICFYSINGNITVNGAHADLCGIVYAPNGTITMNGSHQTINGRVIGNKVTFNGSNLSIISSANDLNSLPANSVRLIE